MSLSKFIKPILGGLWLAAIILAGVKPAFADPSTNGATFIAYQSGDSSVVLVFYGFTETGTAYGLARYEIRRNGILLEPNPIPISATSFEDIGQGLVEGGGPYYYSLTVVDSVGNTATLNATYKDAGTQTDLLCVSGGIRLYVSFPYGNCDNGNVFAGTSWGPWVDFPDPLAPVHAKYLSTARSPATGMVLPGAQVSVYPAGSSAELAVIYADRYGFFTIPNPVTADVHGRFEFFVSNNRFDITVAQGAETYTLSDVTIADPRYAQAIKANDNSAAMTLITRDIASADPDGNYPILLTAPGNLDGSNPTPPYFRIFANAEENGWAMTYNAKWKGSTREWDYDNTPLAKDAAFFRFRNDLLPSLEVGMDQADYRNPPQSAPREMETVVHVGPDKAHFKSLMGAVGIEKIAGENGITQGDVVVLDATGNAFKATTFRALYPFIVTGVDNPSGISTTGDRVYLSIGGSNTLVKLDANMDPCVTIRDPLVTSGGEAGKVVAAPGETDVRTIAGYSNREECFQIPVFWETPIYAIPR